ncbi:DUF302 domain-containing protein [Chlorobaculum sp. 24CR]|uniref:DUF302 domain-containing protein n=1 Tax=Chlorobaculum sp. 24CR TaxID=2508878 RepID=UPI00100A3724|nr:DUF302 domain-containing protein [Chlorobaculum sp. 24CR]RXK88163.1 DUF302 domain-containing protein [Chlorobaculum sp. 24CR]
MNIRSLLIGIAVGILLAVGAGWMMMPAMMLKEYQSPFGVEQTVDNIRENAISQGWVVASVMAIDNSVKKYGGGDLPPVRLVNLCEPNHAYNILKDDKNKIVSVMMPCTISVYQKADGKTWVCVMNAALLGKMFGGVVAEVMGGTVAKQQQQFINFVQ